MRIGKVVGKLSLSKVHASLVGMRWVLAVPHGLAALAGREPATNDELIAVDELGAMPGDWIALSEGMEATFPFHPNRKPIDAYNASILDALSLDNLQVGAILAGR